MKRLKVDVWHNILWSQYKAVVLSKINEIAKTSNVDVKFYQIAETENSRVALSGIVTERHKYPFILLFKGDYYKVNRFKMAWAMCACVARSSADLTLLAGYSRLEFWLQALVVKFRGRKLAVFCDSTIFDNRQTFFKGLAKRMFFAMCDGVFCYGLRAAEYVSFYGVKSSKIVLRCQAAALPEGYDSAQITSLRKAENSNKTRARYLYVGRLAPEKALDCLFHAMVKVIALKPDHSLILIGAGPEEAALKTLAEKLGIRNRVEFGGSRSGEALWYEYVRATCLVLPSRSEPWGLVVNEALSFGCPVIVSNTCGCIPELVIDGVTGFQFNSGDASDLAHKLLKACDDFSDVEAVARRCINHIAPYSPEKAAEAILAGSKRLMAGGMNNYFAE